MPRSSNATASAFGWDFQSNAAIMLMLKNIERASKGADMRMGIHFFEPSEIIHKIFSFLSCTSLEGTTACHSRLFYHLTE